MRVLRGRSAPPKMPSPEPARQPFLQRQGEAVRSLLHVATRTALGSRPLETELTIRPVTSPNQPLPCSVNEFLNASARLSPKKG